MFAASDPSFWLYNEIKKHNLPIRFMHHPTEKSIFYGWFVFEKTLIIVNDFQFEYDSESERWVFSVEVDGEETNVLLSIDEYVETEIAEVNQAFDALVCENAVILICEDDLERSEYACKEERFLLYKDDMIEKLTLFTEKMKKDA